MAQDPQVVYVRQATNGMGLAGFIISLVGWVSCGLLCPIGLVMSLIGLRRRPRGFAVAGVVLGALGSIWGVVAVFFGGLAMLISCGGALCGGIAPHAVTNVRMNTMARDVERFERNNGRMPADLAEAIGHRRGRHDTLDGWGRPLHLFFEQDGSFTIGSDGPDGQPDTADDVRAHHERPGRASHAL